MDAKEGLEIGPEINPKPPAAQPDTPPVTGDRNHPRLPTNWRKLHSIGMGSVTLSFEHCCCEVRPRGET
jgi:hypothetical protein